ncbi:MAG: hypothetical protein IE917_17940, partial [Betaproteobacteria bacterium]|nr:hypothetical protein [Betaproteobacteria bacterium]
AAAGSFALFDMFKTAGKFEQFQIMLEGTEGSAAKAKKAMAWVQGFAEKTPYELDQVMEAFVALKAYGIDPMNGSLMALGDGAWGMSKDLMQAVEALADAMTGEFERLKEFGIRASKQGDKVVFTYRKNGKDIRREAKMTGEDIEKAITGIFSDRFGGGMARQAKTLFGIISNMKDLWSKFLLMVADAGIFDKVKAKLDEWRARLDVMAKDGRLKAWAEKTSKWLEKAFDKGVDFVENTDWQGVAADFERIAQAALRVADAVNAIAANWEKVSWASNHMALPLFTRTLLDGWNAYGNGGNASGRPAVQPKRPASSDPFRRGSPWLRKPGAGAPTRQPAQQVKVGGKTEIDVRLTGPLAASVRSNKSVNPAIGQAVFVGKSMGGPG